MSKYCAITYSGKLMVFTDESYAQFCRLINSGAKFVSVNGNNYAINDFKYFGARENAPPVNDENYVPASQKVLDNSDDLSFDVNKFFQTGEIEAKPGKTCAFSKEKMHEIWEQHVCRRHELNRQAAAKRKEAHEKWLKTVNLDENDPRRNPIFLIHPGYSPAEIAIFKKYNIDYSL